MNKSVLVIPSPSSCFDCPLFKEGIVDTCYPLGRDIHDEEGGFDEDGVRPLWCPLRPLPTKKEYSEEDNPCSDNYEDEYEYQYREGYNICLSQITGDTE